MPVFEVDYAALELRVVAGMGVRSWPDERVAERMVELFLEQARSPWMPERFLAALGGEGSVVTWERVRRVLRDRRDLFESTGNGYYRAIRRCPDGGRCHHECGPGECFRVECCGPLSGVYEGDDWPAEVRAKFRAPEPWWKRIDPQIE